MKISVRSSRIEKEQTEAVVVGVLAESESLNGAAEVIDTATGGMIRDLLVIGDFKGEANQTELLYTRNAIPAKRILLTGLGKAEQFNMYKLRQASGQAAKSLRDLGIKSFVTAIHDMGLDYPLDDAAQAIVEGSILGLYQFNEYKTENRDKIKEVDEIILVNADESKISALKAGSYVGQIVASATNLARDLSNHPGNVATPTMLSQCAQQIASECNLKCDVFSTAKLEELGFGAFLSVAKGSQEPPQFIILEHQPDLSDLPTLVLVGKGVTFDSGGISLKTDHDISNMKSDMSGAAAVLGTLQAVAKLNLPLHIVGLVPATENLPSGSAQKPGDIVKSLSGKTIEITNTDAEGRLILADALTYAHRYSPAAVIDIATLTGACVIALGYFASGLMGNDEKLIEKIKAVAEKSAEKVWQLPLWEEYDELIKSDLADMRNISGRLAGPIQAATFLKRFAEGYPWAHLDIAGTAWVEKDVPYAPKGSTGVGVRLLVQLLRDWEA